MSYKQLKKGFDWSKYTYKGRRVKVRKGSYVGLVGVVVKDLSYRSGVMICVQCEKTSKRVFVMRKEVTFLD